MSWVDVYMRLIFLESSHMPNAMAFGHCKMVTCLFGNAMNLRIQGTNGNGMAP